MEEEEEEEEGWGLGGISRQPPSPSLHPGGGSHWDAILFLPAFLAVLLLELPLPLSPHCTSQYTPIQYTVVQYRAHTL